jgi:5-methylcytosine-specific restriction protein A
MPGKMKHPCNKIGCNKLTHDRYCDTHARLEQRTRDKERGSAAARGYTYKWQQYSKRFLQQFPICAQCGAPATVTDHIIPHKGDMDLFWDRFNHQPLCKRCHDYKTATEDGRFGKKIAKP